MSVSLWTEAFCEERDDGGKITVKPVTKVILFLYLMVHECGYAYNIAQEFKKAIKYKRWIEEKGLTDVKEESKVSSALNAMAKRHLLISRDDAEKRYPAFQWTQEKKQHGRREVRYFSINPEVILSPENIVLSQERREKIIHWLYDFYQDPVLYEKQQLEDQNITPLIPLQPSEKILWESKSDIELLMSYTGLSNDTSDFPWLDIKSRLFQSYDQYLATIRLFENYNADPQVIIEYSNRIATKDYFTILITADAFAHEISSAYQKMQDTQRTPKIISDEVKKENQIFTNLNRLEKAREKTFKEINLPYKKNDPMEYIMSTDIMGYSILLNNAISYLIQQERKVRVPQGRTDPNVSSGNPVDSIKKSKPRSSGKKLTR